MTVFLYNIDICLSIKGKRRSVSDLLPSKHVRRDRSDSFLSSSLPHSKCALPNNGKNSQQYFQGKTKERSYIDFYKKRIYL